MLGTQISQVMVSVFHSVFFVGELSIYLHIFHMFFYTLTKYPGRFSIHYLGQIVHGCGFLYSPTYLVYGVSPSSAGQKLDIFTSI